MNAAETIREIARNAGKSYTDLAREEGVAPQTVQKRLRGDGLGFTVGTLCKMLDALDYELAALPKGSDLPDGSYKVDGL